MNDEAERKGHRRRYHQRKDPSAKLQRDAISSFADSGSAYLSSRCSAMTVCDNSLQRSSAKGRKGRPWPRLLLFLSAMKRNGSHFRLVPLSTSFVDLCLLRPPARTRFPLRFALFRIHCKSSLSLSLSLSSLLSLSLSSTSFQPRVLSFTGGSPRPPARSPPPASPTSPRGPRASPPTRWRRPGALNFGRAAGGGGRRRTGPSTAETRPPRQRGRA